jgi:hypothetical protein
MSFLKIHKVFWRSSTIIYPYSFGNVMSAKRNIGWPSGAFCISQRVSGMGIIGLDTQNKCLLSKWIVKLLNEDGMWQQVLKKKYLKRRTLSQVVKKKGDSHFWAGLMEVKDLVLQEVGLDVKMAPRLDSGRICG